MASRDCDVCGREMSKKDLGMTIRKSVVVSFPCSVGLLGFHPYMLFHFLLASSPGHTPAWVRGQFLVTFIHNLIVEW